VQKNGQGKKSLPFSLLPIPGGYFGFQVTGMIEWGPISKPKKIPRASNKTPKQFLDQKLTTKKSMLNF